MRARPAAAARLLAATVAAAVAAALLVGTAPGAANAVTVNQSFWVPLGKQLVVRGHGFGHGHGMSQYGAEGAARAGLDHQQILDFYYPGTTWSTVKGQVRVLITADTTSDLVVSPAAGLTLRDRGNGTTYPLPDLPGVTRWRLNVGAGNHTVVGYRTSSWHRWLPGGKAALDGDGELFARGPLTLWTPSGARSYRGVLRSASPRAGSPDRDTVNVLSMDAYVQGVIPAEMPASWSPEAVQAQAVAARTYAAWSRAQNPNGYYQICDTTSCQVYRGLDGEDPRGNAAVRATRRQILTYAGKPAFTQFSSSSGGWTAQGSVAYLPAQKDPYDQFAANPVHDWTATIDAARLERTYPSLGRLRRVQVVSRDGNGDWDGRVTTILLDGTEKDVTVSGDAFRSMLGLRSTWFTIDPTPIMRRWQRLGANHSPLGAVRTREYAVGAGSTQRFQRGRIYYSRSTGARELYGAVLGTYRSMRGVHSWLGFPETGVRSSDGGVRVRFRGGTVWSRPTTGTVAVPAPIAARYVRAGATSSPLGWPVALETTRRGQRVSFEHGSISYLADVNRTSLRITG
jgi:stage II sporulation protein D